MIDRAVERLEKESERAACFLAGLSGLRRLDLFSGDLGTTEVVPFHEPSRARAPAPHSHDAVRASSQNGNACSTFSLLRFTLSIPTS
jgi:hypothetical protein